MTNHVNFVFDMDDDSDSVKHWLFLESVRIRQEKQELEEEKRKLEVEKNKLNREKDLFDKQWKILERELKKIGNDRDTIAREKAYLAKEKINLNKMRKEAFACTVNGGFFAGVSSAAGLRKRYRELLKIYHPDSGNGDSATVIAINKEYLALKKRY